MVIGGLTVVTTPDDFVPGTVRVAADGYEKGLEVGRGPWRKIAYHTHWEDSDAFIDALFGVGTIAAPAPGSTWSPPLPHRYPGNENIVALDAVCRPIGPSMPDAVKLFASSEAEVVVTYGTPAFDVFGVQPEMAFGGQPEPWCRDEVRGYVESYPVPSAAVEKKGAAPAPGGGPPVEGTGETPERNFEVKVPHLELRRTRMFVPYLFMPVLTTLAGKLNADWWWGFAPGTLRFEPFDTGTETDTSGRRVSTLVTSLTWRPYDWNMQPRSDGPGWEYIGYPGTAAAPYEYADFSRAFGVWR